MFHMLRSNACFHAQYTAFQETGKQMLPQRPGATHSVAGCTGRLPQRLLDGTMDYHSNKIVKPARRLA